MASLPSASSTYANQGYLINSTTIAGTYDLWVCIASAGGGYNWINAGPYTGGTVITDASGNTTDALNNVDLAYEPFPRIPVNEDCVLLMSADSDILGRANVRVYYYYRSV